MTKINYNDAKELIHYDKVTGLLTWKVRPLKYCKNSHQQNAWNAKYSKKIAGKRDKDGYVIISLLGKYYKAHRLIWLLCFGVWPTYEIDHINHNKADNRLSNLRDVPKAINAKNMPLKVSNKSGLPGVYWDKPRKKWVASIRVDKRNRHLGRFTKLEEAYEKYVSAKKFFGFHPNHCRVI